MNIISYASSLVEIDELSKNHISEIILSPRPLSRFGKIELVEFRELARYAKSKGIKVVCEWDILLTENKFSELLGLISKDDFKSIDEFRVQDVGVLNYVLKNFKQKIQYIAENGNHNINSLHAFERIIGDRLSRFVLSLELPLSKLTEFSEKLSCPTEVLAFGRINLFYSPRKLISPYMGDEQKQNFIEIEVNSEESPHKGFPLIQNSHGTFMMNPKDHCLLENVKELEQGGVQNIRLDLRFDESFKSLTLILDIINNVQTLDKLKAITKRPLIRGFYSINKTDHQFKKLKNHRIQRTDDHYIGEVLDVKKGVYIGFRVKDNADKIKIGNSLEFRTPEGKIKKLLIKEVKNSNQDELTHVELNKIIYTNHVGGISIRTAIYFCQ